MQIYSVLELPYDNSLSITPNTCNSTASAGLSEGNLFSILTKRTSVLIGERFIKWRLHWCLPTHSYAYSPSKGPTTMPAHRQVYLV